MIAQDVRPLTSGEFDILCGENRIDIEDRYEDYDIITSVQDGKVESTCSGGVML